MAMNDSRAARVTRQTRNPKLEIRNKLE